MHNPGLHSSTSRNLFCKNLAQEQKDTFIYLCMMNPLMVMFAHPFVFICLFCSRHRVTKADKLVLSSIREVRE